MIHYNNPITGADINVYTMADAAYVLKLCNENYFSVYYQEQEMWKELNRLYDEIEEQKNKLLAPYQPQDDGVVPPPIPPKVIAAINFLNEQKNTFAEIFRADLADNVAELNFARVSLERKVAEWFSYQRGAAWLVNGSITLSGCTLKFSGSDITFSYQDYEEE